MAHLLKNLTNSIWHGFHALQQHDAPNVVAKSKLKVLTANIGTLMDLYGVEKGLEHYKSTQTLTFEEYLFYLQTELFSSLTDATPAEICNSLEQGIDEICWLVCKKTFLDRPHPVFEDHSVYQLFRVFCLLAETEPDLTDTSYLVTINSEEVARVASHLVSSLGLRWDAADFDALSAAIGIFRFPTFLAVLESKYSGGGSLDNVALREAVDDLYQIYVEDVVKKLDCWGFGHFPTSVTHIAGCLIVNQIITHLIDYVIYSEGLDIIFIPFNTYKCLPQASLATLLLGHLTKKGFLLPTFRYLWFVLRPGELSYYKDSQQKEPSGVISLNSNCWADAASNGAGKPDRRFVLSTPEHRCIELIAEDHRGRLQWLAAFKIAIKHSSEKTGYQRSLADQRRSLRQATKKHKEETRLALHYERQARIAAEIQAKNLEAISKEEGAKLQELEDVKRKLEILLQEETQALRDEEIVRNLQARVLREEWEKREELERLQQEQQRENEQQLQQLEAEKESLDAELNAAREKIRRAEEALLMFDTRIVVTRPLRTGERIRRTQSFVPATTTTKERLNDRVEL